MPITHDTIMEAIGIGFGKLEFDGLGDSDSHSDGRLLTYLANSKFAEGINSNHSITGAFVKESDANFLRPHIKPMIVEDPKWCFFKLLDHVGRQRDRKPSIIAATAHIHPSAVIATEGVTIGENVVIEPNAVIMSDVVIGAGTIIRAGVTVGCDGFLHQRTSRGILSVTHDGNIEIGKRVEIGPNCTIIKGFSYRNTIIGDDSKFDAQGYYSHGVRCGRRCLFGAGVMIAGHVAIGEDVWIGPGATISNRISIGDRGFITLGSVVVKDVSADEKVTGNFAIPHEAFIRDLKDRLTRRRTPPRSD